MYAILNSFWKICLLRLAPQDLPTSSLLLALSLLMYVLSSIVVGLVNMSPLSALLSGVVDVLIVAGLTFLLLWVRDLGVRYMQTLTALAGSGTILAVFAAPVLWWQVQQPDVLPMVSTMLMMALLTWNLVVVGHVLRHAITTKLYLGILIALVYLYVAISIISSLFKVTG
jgi:hypothetical protein